MAARVWNTTLKEISNEVIDKALEECVEIHKWPPEIAEFKQLCVSLNVKPNKYWVDSMMKIDNVPNSKVKVFIDEGAEICKRLKSLYPDKSWMKIGNIFGSLKNKAKVFYPDLNEINLIREISKYTDEDILDLLNIEMKK